MMKTFFVTLLISVIVFAGHVALLLVTGVSAGLAQDRICFTRPDGGLSIVIPADGVSLAEAQAAAVPSDAVTVRLCDSASLPPDREFRNAWVDDGAAVVEDVAMARDVLAARIEAAKLRWARDLVDREMLGEDVTAEKNKLRAIDARGVVDAARDMAEMRAAWPATLPR